ncbi:MAG: aspartate/glutamate racemase family protein [Myxococcales bacterium]|nr:aspartate/glutamate racemase family protein [Myxococcales bacterium]
MSSVVVIDSGMGGLAVAARLYERARLSELALAVEFVDIRPPPGRRFEDRRSHACKLAVLDQALAAIERNFALDLVVLACNSLSTLIPDTDFHARHHRRLLTVEPPSPADCRTLADDAEVLLFATELTIESGVHRRALISAGVDDRRIVEQPCPGLANSIQDDHACAHTQALLGRFVVEAVERRAHPHTPAGVVLACSHYGFKRRCFAAALEARGVEVDWLLCPSDAMSDAVFERLAADGRARTQGLTRTPGGPSIGLHSHHPVSTRERDNFVDLISPLSVDTAAALDHVRVLA